METIQVLNTVNYEIFARVSRKKLAKWITLPVTENMTQSRIFNIATVSFNIRVTKILGYHCL